MANERLQWQIETADLDYQYEQYEMNQFVIDRSDSMEEDIVLAKGINLTTHSIKVDRWVNTYDKFLNQLFVVLFGMFMMSCTTDMIPTEEYVINDTTESVSAPTPRVLNGLYQVDYVIHEYADGSTILATYEGSPYWEERDAQMSQTTYEFKDNKLFIGQLMDNGWMYGDVSVKWKNGMPTRVGCKYVESATENFISWMQNDVLIKHYLTKL